MKGYCNQRALVIRREGVCTTIDINVRLPLTICCRCPERVTKDDPGAAHMSGTRSSCLSETVSSSVREAGLL